MELKFEELSDQKQKRLIIKKIDKIIKQKNKKWK